MSDLLQAQFEFTEDLASLISWIRNRGWTSKISEMGVLRSRFYLHGNDVARVVCVDAVHIRNSNHYLSLAADIQLFIPNSTPTTDDDFVKDSEHPAWKELETFWRSLRPDNRTGRSFNDANHVARLWNGVV